MLKLGTVRTRTCKNIVSCLENGFAARLEALAGGLLADVLQEHLLASGAELERELREATAHVAGAECGVGQSHAPSATAHSACPGALIGRSVPT